MLHYAMLCSKSTYCHAMVEHAAAASSSSVAAPSRMQIANLDPAAEHFPYPVQSLAFDIRDLISVDEVMQELGLGPNGALLYCMEYLLDHMDWLQEQLDEIFLAENDNDAYLLLDCPGQLELYTHVPIMKTVLDRMKDWGYDGSMVSIFCIDAAFLIDASKFLSGSLLSLSAMVALELPHISVLTKCDLMSEQEIERILNYGSATHLWDLEQDRQSLLWMTTTTTNTNDNNDNNNNEETTEMTPEQRREQERLQQLERRRLQRERLTNSISQLLDDWQMVSFVPLNITSEESIDHVLSLANHSIQYGEDLEVRGAERDDDLPGIINEEGIINGAE